MNWVKCNIIEGFCPLSHGGKEWVRASLKLTALNNKAVKQVVVDMYAATASQYKMEMAAQIGGMRLLHLNRDLWVDKFSSLKCIGIRLFYIDRTWVLRSRLIAVRQFNPTKELLEDNRLLALLQKYLESVLEEYGLDVSLLFSATSDAGSDAFGTHVDPAKSRSPVVRKVIATVKMVMEHIRKSPRAKVSFAVVIGCGVTNVLEAVIVNRAAIDGVYTTEGKDSPLTSLTDEIDELFSIIKPAAQVIVKCQQTSVPTVQLAVLALAALKLTTLNVDSPLEILTPARKLAQAGTSGIGGRE
ncbi:unnamed protein product [Ectocarpus sp. CCAP 1310/34]|nr:unnamed protein product [Ectocarpus sp. CCAP 1310/34]